MHADELFEQFLTVYPQGRRQRGYIVTHLFIGALEKVGFDVLMTAVTQHKRSAQWKNPALVPLMKTWFEEERWVQVLPEDSEAAAAARRALLTSAKTAECSECRDTGWADVLKGGEEVCIPCSCRSTNQNYQRMTASSRKGNNEEVKG